MKKLSTVRAYIDYYALTTPEKIFLIDAASKQHISYQQLKTDINKIAGFFQAQHLKKTDHIAFLLDNSYPTTALFLATMYCGLTVVPINVVAGKKQIAYVLEHAQCKIIFTASNYQKQFSDLLKTQQCPVFNYNHIDDINTHQAPVNHLPISDNQNALLIYTSGTTGLPKGVLLTHKNIIAGGLNTANAHQLSSDDRALCVLPLYHINGEIVTVLAPLVSHSSVVMLGKFSVSLFWQTLIDYHCTWFSIVPTIVSYLINDANKNKINRDTLKHIRFGRSASAPLAPEIHKQFEQLFAIHLVETMGLTETAAQILANPLKKGKYGSAGIAIGNQAKIIDTAHKTLPAGQQGELVIKGDNVMNAYYRNKKATDATFTQDGWLLTGDLAKQDADGFFFITGRKKELIIKGGENISPREIDDVLYQHPSILEACTFAMPDNNYGETIAVCIFLKEKQTSSSEAIKTFCRQLLGDFKTPSMVFFQPTELPKGPSGKIQRLKIASEYNKTPG